jgi:hypothetical protein
MGHGTETGDTRKGKSCQASQVEMVAESIHQRYFQWH